MNSLSEELKRRADPSVIVALVGNKCDLESKRVIEREVLHLPFFCLFSNTFKMGW